MRVTCYDCQVHVWKQDLSYLI